MRNTARWAAALTLTAASVLGPVAGTALASPLPSPASLYAPSDLVMTLGHGESAALVTPQRAVTLTCAPTASGSHPSAAEACAELRSANGDINALTARSGALCTKAYDPVVVTVGGVWQGKRVAYERTFANECVKSSYGRSLFAF
ncbi:MULTISPECIES: subtilase-type protease inhibitor [Streptomyces]|uniref:Probable subtilase-type protease inhibitor n=1 Tax=Streptomyces doudnae TaxID=3075536 RepID=A0ABD5EGH2_9ACTN|nr:MULTISPECIES: subtilase-type protease inhibitor [unclassified Streptomyces]MDT0433771.1 subtilase-type protease inhibitor [Streptomyces sp. DSM 41981]MYQ68933.1 protease inhibitor protein [Streptomyces sp. SID4950]SCE50150.1 Subtilisin inhibitor-like [Streptomyces sp. SolWspMP-5a-2]